MIIREAFYGTCRVDDFERHCGISPSVLSARPRNLVADGIPERTRYWAPGARGRDEYRLTDKGQPGPQGRDLRLRRQHHYA
ncbi:winged helix-turn-helix transcriptional regulator [Streptomyces griseorubiginosus]|uniref:winged helix-turn-helix transcriptional regulator n=1 Tax=Streptomyces griseorubiginosus TaxID=67304 RepID=UPI0033AC7E46